MIDRLQGPMLDRKTLHVGATQQAPVHQTFLKATPEEACVNLVPQDVELRHSMKGLSAEPGSTIRRAYSEWCRLFKLLSLSRVK